MLDALLALTHDRVRAELVVGLHRSSAAGWTLLSAAGADDLASTCLAHRGEPVELPDEVERSLQSSDPVAVAAGALACGDSLAEVAAVCGADREVMALPVEVDGEVVGAVLAYRAGAGRFDAAEAAELTKTAARVGALGAPRKRPGPSPSRDDGPSIRSWIEDRPGVGTALGIAAPGSVVAVVLRSEDPLQYRPLAILIGVVVALAVAAGRRAAIAGAVTAIGLGWWHLTAPFGSPQIATFADGAGLFLYAGTMAGVVALVDQVERARRRSNEERQIVDELFDRTPVGIALFDRKLRFQRVNRRLSEINGRPVEEHLGRPPSEVSPLAGEAYEHLLAQVLEHDEPISERIVSVDHPQLGEKHWRVSYYPVGPAGARLGVGATVEDVSAERLRLQRAELLLRASRAFGSAMSIAEAEVTVAGLLAESLRARVSVVHVHRDGHVSLETSMGYDEEPRWIEQLGRAHDGPLGRCLASGERVIEQIGDAPTSAEWARRDELGERTVLWQPVLSGSSGRVAGAFSIAWTFDRQVTEESKVLLETVATLGSSSAERIELFEREAHDRFTLAMDAMTDHVTVASAIRDGAGTILDFQVEFMNATGRDGAGRGAEEMVGRRVCDLYPQWRASGMFDRFRAVVETGVPIVQDRMPYEDRLEDGTPISGWWNLQVVRFDDGYLAASRDVTDIVLAERAAAEAELAAQREAAAIDLLQRAALPRDLPELGWLEVGAAYRPAASDRPVGGDWYDAFVLEDGRICLVIADVSGHGQEAAAFMLQVRNAVRALATREDDLGDLMDAVNHVLCAGDHPDLFVTACIATVDPETLELCCALAGHPPLLRTSSEGTEPLWVEPGPPLGAFRSGTWPLAQWTLEPGDRLIGYTDGLIERRDEPLDAGLDRLAAFVGERLDLTPSELADALACWVDAPADDQAILCVRVADAEDRAGPLDGEPEAPSAAP